MNNNPFEAMESINNDAWLFLIKLNYLSLRVLYFNDKKKWEKIETMAEKNLL